MEKKKKFVEKMDEIGDDFFDFKIDLFDEKEEPKKYEKKNSIVDDDNQLQNLVITEQEDYTKLIYEMSLKFKEVKDLVQLQVDMYSTRQILIERKSFFNQLSNKLNKQLKDKKYNEFTKLKTKGHNNIYLKNGGESTIIIDALLNDLLHILNIISDHQQFIDSSVDTIDRMIFGLKHRIQIEEIKEKSIVGY